MLAQLAQAVLHVVEHRLHHASASHVVAAVQYQRKIAESAPRGVLRCPSLRALPHVLVGAHVHVKVQFLANLVRDRVAPEERAHSRNRDSDGDHVQVL